MIARLQLTKEGEEKDEEEEEEEKEEDEDEEKEELRVMSICLSNKEAFIIKQITAPIWSRFEPF